MEIKYIFRLGELFEKVQLQAVFPDSKTFVDCTPKTDLTSIRDRYEAEKNSKDFDLTAFVHEHFILPKNYATGYKSNTQISVSQHIEDLWPVLTRQPQQSHNSLIPLPHPYVVPGGRFREVYYWDSYFTMLGLQISKRVDLIENMIDNFSDLIRRFGYIPNGNRTYYLDRSQPPFFACMVRLLSGEKGEDILVKYLPSLQKEYDFWMQGSDELSSQNNFKRRVVLLPEGNILNRYCDGNEFPRPEAYKEEVKWTKDVADKKTMYLNLRGACESGWDFSSRWYKDENDFSSIHTTDIIPVDLNCLLHYMEQTIANAYELSGDSSTSAKFRTLAGKRAEAINTYCWNEENGFYFDYDWRENKQKKWLTVAAAFPLYFDLASKKQAGSVASILKDKFYSNGGLLTTLQKTNQQWDAPNGWAPLQWIAIKGLAKYGFIDLAKEITRSWMNINEKVYEDTGKMMEKYNVVDTDLKAGGGEYPAQDGFGWTNGVYLALQQWMKQIE
jgi:alpha,alpha-trehalase